ncbi:hypothetical protein QLX08_011563 [Tetragonisca angustula]|uniref:Uncharacterized protein n=1 Tax=Tetragonisca angustula TaxID=166442 RepID=A0AAW0Z7T9_9HYME
MGNSTKSKTWDLRKLENSKQRDRMDRLESVARENRLPREEKQSPRRGNNHVERGLANLLAGLALLYKWTPIASPSICSGGQVAAHS